MNPNSIAAQIQRDQDNRRADRIKAELYREYIEDKELREKHPSLQKAWEEYQLVKELCK